MTVFITDANIFIDLYYAGLLKLMPSLGLSFATTQLVSDELNQEQQFDLQLLITLNTLQIREVSLPEIQRLNLSKGLSLPDRSVICVAVRENGVLVTGDGLVRRTAGNFGLEVRGLLWLFDEFVSMNLISPFEAAEKLEFLVVEKGSRQPNLDYNARLEKWRTG